MMEFFLHYRIADGEIVGWGMSFEPQAINETMAIAFVEPCSPDPAAQRYDAASGNIVDKNAEQKRAARLPKQRELEEAIYRELSRTDLFMIDDYPLPDGARPHWLAYRRMLRELSRLPSPAEMIEAWQRPPDDIDPISDLRERLKS